MLAVTLESHPKRTLRIIVLHREDLSLAALMVTMCLQVTEYINALIN